MIIDLLKLLRQLRRAARRKTGPVRHNGTSRSLQDNDVRRGGHSEEVAALPQTEVPLRGFRPQSGGSKCHPHPLPRRILLPRSRPAIWDGPLSGRDGDSKVRPPSGRFAAWMVGGRNERAADGANDRRNVNH